MTPEELLADHTEAVRGLTRKLRALLLEEEPMLEERVDEEWHGLGYAHPDAGDVVALFPTSDQVKVSFEHGKDLADPRGLLVFEKRQQVGYVSVAPGDPIPLTGLRELLRAAIDAGARRKT
jgi:hypothetical protein